jgi:4-amino-4-deoxy-L-arabinose transferase-like glycosyltransferase
MISSLKTIGKLVNSDRWWLWSLLGAALILYEVNLGSLPLRDWDEATIASVARNIWRGASDLNAWLYPTLDGNPYWNKPPLIHWAIALAYSCFGVSEWSTRIIPATLSAICVPLIYAIARAIFANRLTAIFSALVYLTLLPVVRHGRLAMLDGAVIFWFGCSVWCLLKGRFDRRFFLGFGLSLGAICLTKGMAIGVLLGLILALFLAWDAPQLLGNSYLWLGIISGLIPAISWYWLQYLHYGTEFIGINLGTQTFSRIWSSIEEHHEPFWYYLLEVVKYGLPWCLFLPDGISLAAINRQWSWAKLTLVWSSVYFLSVSAMATKLPWYIMPLYPALALLIGVNLTRIWQFPTKYYSRVENGILALLAIGGWGASLYYLCFGLPNERDLFLPIAGLALTITISTVLRFYRSRYFIAVLIAGLYLAFWLFFTSNHWIWELGEAYPVKPIAAAIESNIPPGQIIYTSFPYSRPSLNFYSDRVVISTSISQLQRYWTTKPIYLLLDTATMQNFKSTQMTILESKDDWQLITNR